MGGDAGLGGAFGPQEIRRMAKYQAGLMLTGNLNGWEPDDLVAQYGQETVDAVALEMTAIANRLKKQGGRP